MPALATLCRSYSLRVSAAGVVLARTVAWVVWDQFRARCSAWRIAYWFACNYCHRPGAPLTSEKEEGAGALSVSHSDRCVLRDV